MEEHTIMQTHPETSVATTHKVHNWVNTTIICVGHLPNGSRALLVLIQPECIQLNHLK